MKIRINLKMVVIALLLVIILFPKSLYMQISKASSDSHLTYKVYYQDYGWSTLNSENNIDKADKRLEAIKVDINADDETELTYSVYNVGAGWSSEVNGGIAVGKVSQNAPISKVKINLNGTLAQNYDIQYRVCFEEGVWSKWFSNGEVAGNQYNPGIYNIEIRLVDKNL